MAHLVLAGGGHAHMLIMANLRLFIKQGHRVTVIGPSAYHYYSGMGPGMLGGTYTAEQIRFATKNTVESGGGKFILDSVVRINPDHKTILLASGREVDYDVLSCNAGSQVNRDLISRDDGDIFTVKPIEKLLDARKRIVELASRRRVKIGIVGGGPSSAEIAGNIRHLANRKNLLTPEIKVFAGQRFMHNFTPKIQKLVKKSLTGRGIEIMDAYAKEIKTGEIRTAEGCEPFDVIFVATGIKPSPIFRESNLETGPEGGLLVNRFLQSPEHPDIFGGGDCIYFKDEPLDKVGVYAVRENPILLNNLMSRLVGRELIPFQPGSSYLLIFNLGEGVGVLHKNWITLKGRLAFIIKDYIDRKFMRRFQTAAEK